MKNKKAIIMTSVAVLILGAGSYFFLKEEVENFTHIEIPVKRGELIIKIQSTGTVSPLNRLEIKPPVAGRIEEVLVNEGDKVKKGKTLAWISSNERAALLDAVRLQGAAEIKKWENLYKATPVIAPISGTIILRSVEAGQSFASTDSIFTMADRLAVKANVDETDIAQVKINQKAVITLDAYPNNPIEGKVTHLAYDATLTNNVTTYEVDVIPNEIPDFMRSGMTSNVSIEVDGKKDVLIIPKSTLVSDEEGTGVLTKNGEKKTMAPIQTGLDDGKFIEVVSGLNENDIVYLKEMKLLGKKNKSSNPLFPSGPRRGGKK